VASLRTEITEVVTGLAMLGGRDLASELARRPAELANVSGAHWDRLGDAWAAGAERASFTVAWANGRAFLASPAGLRGRPPLRVEWKGEHRAPDFELVPADLRVDHVYLVSCKYRSKVLMNPAPAHLFDHCLATRPGPGGRDWYEEVAPAAYQALYDEVRAALGGELPAHVGELGPGHRERLKRELRRDWPAPTRAAHADFVRAVSTASARRWRAAVPTLRQRETLLWRLLRMQAAPYFLLGSSRAEGPPLRLRIGTPWDWRQAFRLVDLALEAGDRGQPEVRWSAVVADRERGGERVVRGHVEVRWSHGRFCGSPEAKVYLDTPHHEVPGYVALG
jgi:hypothetical protein